MLVNKFAVFLSFILGYCMTPSGSSSVLYLSECKRNPKISEHCERMLPYARGSEMLLLMNTKIDPCTDFYEFACGTWSRINKAFDVPSTGFFEKLDNGLSHKIADVLKSPSDPEETQNDKKVKSFYVSCMKLLKMSISEILTTLKLIASEFGSMPLLNEENWNEKNFDWLETIARIKHKYGIQIIIDFDIIADFKENTRNRIYFGQAELAMESKSIYVDEKNEESIKYRKLYAKKISKQISTFFQLDKKKADEIATSIVKFESLIAKGMQDDKTSRSLDETAKLITPAEMTCNYAPTLNISRYFEITLEEPIKEAVYELNEDFQKNLIDVIQKTPKRTLANYIFYQLLKEFFPRIAKNEKSQHDICSEVLKEHFSKILDNIIYRRYNSKDTESEIKSVWKEIKKSFQRELNSVKLSWMSKAVRERALSKLDKMTLEINSYEGNDFDKEMDELVIKNDSFIENVKNILENNSKKKTHSLHESPAPYEASEQLSYTPVNLILENKIKIPVSLLQPYYLWYKGYPKALMYGTLGYLIGHELIHGFDDNGRDYDEVGNQDDWWDEISTEAFNKRTECFIDQYHKYWYGGAQLPRSESQAENIADNGGVQIAYDAYLNWLKEKEDSKLPFLNYTPKQLFFISFAQIWCSDTHTDMMALQAITDDHVPGKFRVIGVLSNFNEFAKEFKCEANSIMNPKKKCEIY